MAKQNKKTEASDERMGYVVPADRCVRLDDGTYLAGPAEVPDGALCEKTLEGFVRNGSVRRGVVGASGARVERPPRPVSKWAINPLALEQRPLEELNVMVRERDPSIPPFKTREEAIAKLSSDFVEDD